MSAEILVKCEEYVVPVTVDHEFLQAIDEAGFFEHWKELGEQPTDIEVEGIVNGVVNAAYVAAANDRDCPVPLELATMIARKVQWHRHYEVTIH